LADKLQGSLQENLLVLLCWSDTSFQLIRNSVATNLFTTDVYRDIIQRIYDYIDAHHKPPKDHLPDLVEDALEEKGGELYRDVIKGVRAVRKTINEEYVLNQLSNFVRQQELKLGIIEASEKIQAGDIEEAESAIERALKRRLAVFDRGMTLTEALTDLKKHGSLRDALLMGIPELDAHHLGPAYGELYGLLGPRKGGKSWFCLHVAKQSIIMREPVVIVTLEIGEKLYNIRMLQTLYSMTLNESKPVYVRRFEKNEAGIVTNFRKEKIKRLSLMTGEGQTRAGRRLVKDKYEKLLRIKAFPTGTLTINGINAYLDNLDRLERFQPRTLIVDYPKLMKHDAANLRIELGITLERLRGIGIERNCRVVVVGQANREGVKKGTTEGVHAAEDFSITHTADILLTYSRTAAEYQLGLARLGVDASRVSRQNINVMISQSYELGQFCLDSTPMKNAYHDKVKELSGKDLDDLETGEDE
jgi:replicative DNA helicase